MFHSVRLQRILEICTGGWSEFTKSKYSMQDNNGKRATANAFRVEKQNNKLKGLGHQIDIAIFDTYDRPLQRRKWHWR